MSESNGNGVNVKWAQILLLLGAQVASMIGGYAVLKFEVEDHARRLDAIEKKQDANFIPRSEYDNRHQDLIRQMEELKAQMREIERRLK